MDYRTNILLNLPYILYGGLGLFLVFQLYYLLFVYTRLARYKVESIRGTRTTPSVSVIICARNEQENLKSFLPTILQQDYLNFEVIVVNDYSDDETKWILQDFQTKYRHLKIVDIKEHVRLKHSKKFALTMGIKAAQYEHLLLTDADCQPQGTHWLSEMAGAFTEGKELILGYSPYFKNKGFLNKLIRFETTHTAMSYLSYALKKNTYMGVGRNLAYTKSLFFKGKGFNAHMHIKSGDDDLFVNHNATAANVNIAIHPDAHVYSLAKDTWKSYYKQKARHAGASIAYKKKHQYMLGTQLFTAIAFYLMLIVCLTAYPSRWYFVVGAYLLRLLLQFIIFKPIYSKLAVKDILLWLPILDLFFYFYICFNGIFNRNKKQKSWK